MWVCRLPVHIGPAVCIVFTETCSESTTFSGPTESSAPMSLSLGQSESYINKIENRRTLPSMTGFFYICEYLNITPQEFFNFDAAAPRKAKELLHEIEKLTPEQSEHVLQIVRDISHK